MKVLYEGHKSKGNECKKENTRLLRISVNLYQVSITKVLIKPTSLLSSNLLLDIQLAHRRINHVAKTELQIVTICTVSTS